LLHCGVYAPAWQYRGDHDLDSYIRGVAGHYATDPVDAAKILQLAHGPHVAATRLETRQRAAKGAGSGFPGPFRLLLWFRIDRGAVAAPEGVSFY
jgi:hypothetical protein